MNNITPSTISLLLVPFTLLALIFLILYPNDFALQKCLSPSIVSNDLTGQLSPPRPDFRLLIGILTLPDKYERRHLLRLIFSLQPVPSAHIDVRFVFCNLTSDDQRTLVALEIMRYDDIVILDCEENMNKGKTYSYFSSIPAIFGALPYDYVMKADDDVYLRLPRLAEALKGKPRTDFYYGFVIPCDSMDPFRDYMSGMGYVLSWDLVEWIAAAEYPKNHTVGPEDKVTGSWLREGNRGKNRFNGKPAMYDFPIPAPIDTCSHEFVPDTIAVHRLKDRRRWARTLEYFSATEGLRPSRLYHLSQFS